MIPAAVAPYLPVLWALAFLALLGYVIVLLSRPGPIARPMTAVGTIWVTLLVLGMVGVHDLRTQAEQALATTSQDTAR